MKIFRDFTLHWWQVGIFKITLTVFGILIGSFWHEFFTQYLGIIFLVFVIGTIYLTAVWFKKDTTQINEQAE